MEDRNKPGMSLRVALTFSPRAYAFDTADPQQTVIVERFFLPYLVQEGDTLLGNCLFSVSVLSGDAVTSSQVCLPGNMLEEVLARNVAGGHELAYGEWWTVTPPDYNDQERSPQIAIVIENGEVSLSGVMANEEVTLTVINRDIPLNTDEYLWSVFHLSAFSDIELTKFEMRKRGIAESTGKEA